MRRHGITLSDNCYVKDVNLKRLPFWERQTIKTLKVLWLPEIRQLLGREMARQRT
jgi:hypothetical protein